MYKRQKLSLVLVKRSETIARLKKDLAVIGEADQKIHKAIPRADKLLEFIAALEKLAGKNSLEQSLKFGTPSSLPAGVDSRLLAVDYNVTLNGNIGSLIGYLNDLEKLPYFAGVTSMNLTALRQPGWSDESYITIQGKLYARNTD